MALNLALIFTPLLFWSAVRAVQAWRSPSPTSGANPGDEAKAQVTAQTAAPDGQGRGDADDPATPPPTRHLAAVQWAERALRRIGRDR
jgi:hypothetical protein